MKKIYICHTSYQLLLTIIKNFDILNFIDIYISNNIQKNIIHRISKYSDNVHKFSENEKYMYLEGDIFIYNDWTKVGEYLRTNKIYYNLIEDGYDYYSYNLYLKYFSRKRRFYNYFFRSDVPFGFSKYVKSIEVNDKSVVVKDRRYKKMIEVPRKELFNNLSEEKKNIILDIFNVTPMLYDKSKKSLLILTQPLYQDNWDKEIINSEEDQIKYFKDIISRYSDNYVIYIKVHPRDNTDYSSLETNVIFLDKNIPMELYEFVGDYTFDIGITHSSTALEFLSCVKEKIYLRDLRNKL